MSAQLAARLAACASELAKVAQELAAGAQPGQVGQPTASTSGKPPKATGGKGAKDATPAPAAGPGYEEIRAAINTLATDPAKGGDVIRAIFKTFGVSNAKDVPQAKWGDLLAALKAAIAGDAPGAEPAEDEFA